MARPAVRTSVHIVLTESLDEPPTVAAPLDAPSLRVLGVLAAPSAVLRNWRETGAQLALTTFFLQAFFQ